MEKLSPVGFQQKLVPFWLIAGNSGHELQGNLVDKEAECVCGPILKRLADKAGVVYTAEDGDQPSLTMGLMSWAQMLGLEIIGGGYLHEAISVRSGVLVR